MPCVSCSLLQRDSGLCGSSHYLERGSGDPTAGDPAQAYRPLIAGRRTYRDSDIWCGDRVRVFSNQRHDRRSLFDEDPGRGRKTVTTAPSSGAPPIVCLKEGRPLLLDGSGDPLAQGSPAPHVAGGRGRAIIAPPVPAFYTRPNSIADIVDYTARRALQRVGVSALAPEPGQGFVRRNRSPTR